MTPSMIQKLLCKVFSVNKGISRVCGSVLLVLLSLTSSSFAESSLKITNFGYINDSYYRGAQPKEHDYADLARFGIRSVIDLTSADGNANEKAMVEQSGFKYFQIPMTTHVAPTPAQIAQFFQIVNDPANQPVYVHCVGGEHRTGVMTAIYRISQNGWTADQAFKEMKRYNFGPDFLHPEFKSFVYDYYSQLDTGLKRPAHKKRTQTHMKDSGESDVFRPEYWQANCLT